MFKKLLLSLLCFLSLSNCSDESDAQFFEYVNSELSKKQIQLSKAILIGDSNVSCIKKTKGFKELDITVGKNKSGINTDQLISLLNTASPDDQIEVVFIAIGTNDGYSGDSSLKLKNKLNEIYPNNKELYVIWGSRGWGGVKNKTLTDQEKFYKKFEKNGFKVIKSTLGFFKTDELAHTCGQDYHKDIIKQMGSILNK